MNFFDGSVLGRGLPTTRDGVANSGEKILGMSKELRNVF